MDEQGKPLKAKRLSAADLLTSSDPLSDDACSSLVEYGEEDELVDFKESFDADHAKSWIDLAVDCVAFANARGGYIVFGVKNKTWAPIGVTADTADALGDIKQVLEKINRKLNPQITSCRTRVLARKDLTFVVLYVPASHDFTHIFEADVEWSPPSGKSIVQIRKGAIYVRRVGSNQILTSTDFEQLIGRRLQRFREKLLDGLVRVVNAQPDHEVVTVVRTAGPGVGDHIRVVDAPTSSGLSGKALALRADTLVEKIQLHMVLCAATADHLPDRRVLYEAFASRHELQIDNEQREWLAKYSAVVGAPAFFWLASLKAPRARDVLEKAFALAPYFRKLHILKFSGFFGTGLYADFNHRLERIGADFRARPFQDKRSLLNVGPSDGRARDEGLATSLARDLSKATDSQKYYELERLDCSLYAPFD